MTCLPRPALPALAPGDPAHSVSPAVCGRLLLYVRGMEIDPVLGLELALQSLRRVAEGPPAEEGPAPAAMRELHRLLRERKIDFRVAGRDGRDLCSAPPMRRRAMIAEEMDRTPIRTATAFSGVASARTVTTV